MRRVTVLAIVVIGSLPGLGRAAGPLPKELAAVPNDALAFQSLNVAAVWDHPAFRGLRDALAKTPAADDLVKFSGIRLENLERLTTVVLPPTKPGERRFEPELVLLLTTRKPFVQADIIKTLELYGIEEAKTLEAGYKPGDKRPKPSGKGGEAFYIKADRGDPNLIAFVGDRTLVLWRPEGRIGKPADFQNPLDLLKAAADTGPLSDGIALAAQHPLAAAVNAAGLKAASVASNDPPPEPFLPLLKADKLTAFAKLNKESAEFTVTATFAGKQWAADGEEAAKLLKGFVLEPLKDDAKRTRKREGDDSPQAAMLDVVVDVFQKTTLKRDENAVTLTGMIDLGPKTQALLAAMPKTAAGTASMTMSANNLKQIGLAMHNMHDTNGWFPTDSYDANGKPLLSWRVHILPYVEQDGLYQQFKLDEPWDSDHNKKLIEKMPPVYALPGVKTKEAGLTFYQGFGSGKDEAARAFFKEGEKQGLRIVSIVDGTSNTILCVEAEDAVTWTKPGHLPFSANNPLPKFGQHFMKERFQALLCDGSVRSFSTKLSEKTLKAYITADGAEVIDEEK